MKAIEVIDGKVTERGIPIAELARRTGIDKELLRRSLSGSRKLGADEFIPICKELNLSLADFTTVA